MILDNPTDDVIDQNTNDDVIVNDANGSDGSSPTNDVTTDVDDKGVSWQNRFLESNRKLENLTKSIPQMIQEAAQLAAQQAQANVPVNKQPEYSVEQYIAAKQKDPVNAAYYDTKIHELQKQDLANTVTTQLTQFQRQQKEAADKQQAETWAVNNFPQLKDPNSAYSQQVWNLFNSRPADKREPYDFAIAAEIVASRMGIKPASLNTSNAAQEALQKKERELKKLQKERSIEGDGRGSNTANSVSKRQADLNAALKSGDIKSYIQNHWLKPKEVAE